MFKRPIDVLDWTLEWIDWLRGDTITSVAYKVPASSGMVKTREDHTTDSTVLWLSGGKKGTYKVSCIINTAMGRTKELIQEMEVL